MNTGNSVRTVWAGTISALVLVIAFGNQWLWEEILEKRDVGENSGWHILEWLSTPHWVVDDSGFYEELPGKNMTGYLLGVLALLATVAFVLASASRRGQSNVFLCGWFSLVAGGAAYNLVAYLIAGPGGLYAFADSSSDDRSLDGTLGVLAFGGGYGFLAGWAVGLVCLLAASSAHRPGQFGAQFSYSSPPQTPPSPPSYPPHGGNRPY
ncbi:hypothetical protein [Yinghuangia sp. YIM S10712]|uniref:hypothetical protein n=1 Tax=Yinghuangia sp. YIM S10712 TaxID=3436930 RepID=UPI003F5312D6